VNTLARKVERVRCRTSGTDVGVFLEVEACIVVTGSRERRYARERVYFASSSTKSNVQYSIYH
jgi:hypothetical protein